VDGHPATRYIWAPAAWEGWAALPGARVEKPE
jgi:hypothetical protein